MFRPGWGTDQKLKALYLTQELWEQQCNAVSVSGGEGNAVSVSGCERFVVVNKSPCGSGCALLHWQMQSQFAIKG